MRLGAKQQIMKVMKLKGKEMWAIKDAKNLFRGPEISRVALDLLMKVQIPANPEFKQRAENDFDKDWDGRILPTLRNGEIVKRNQDKQVKLGRSAIDALEAIKNELGAGNVMGYYSATMFDPRERMIAYETKEQLEASLRRLALVKKLDDEYLKQKGD